MTAPRPKPVALRVELQGVTPLVLWRQPGRIHEVDHDWDVSAWREERRVSVAAVVSELDVRGEFEYRFDMGDDWCHRPTAQNPNTN